MTFPSNLIVFCSLASWYVPCTIISSTVNTCRHLTSQELMRAFSNAIFEWIFGCHHRKLSRVFTIDHKTYRVCFGCGRKLPYSWRAMSLIKPSETPQTLASFRAAFSHAGEQFTGSIAGNLSSVPSRVPKGGRESLGKAGRTGTSVPSFNMNRTDSSARVI